MLAKFGSKTLTVVKAIAGILFCFSDVTNGSLHVLILVFKKEIIGI